MAKPTAARVHDAALINAAADAFDARHAAARNVTSRASVKAERNALRNVAALVDGAKAAGYSDQAAESLINQGEARAHTRKAIVNGATGSAAAPVGIIKVKSDGKRDRLIDAARRMHGRETERPANHWDGTEGYQEASLKDDAADTGDWFN